MFNIRSVMLFIVALTLVTVLAITAYFKVTTTATSPSSPVSSAKAVPQSASLAPASVSPSGPRSFYMSNQTIKNILDQAYEQHRWGAREQALVRILDGRYEYRVSQPR
jgi:hypothetical protein